jgi:hypothetical protein
VKGGLGWETVYLVLLYGVSFIAGRGYGIVSASIIRSESSMDVATAPSDKLAVLSKSADHESTALAGVVHKDMVATEKRKEPADERWLAARLDERASFRNLLYRLGFGLRRLFLMFYGDNEIVFYAWVIRSSAVWIRTKERLFYGFVHSYEKDSKGEIEYVALTDAYRFSRRPVEACLADGQNPLSSFPGTLLIRWSEVVDINLTEPQSFIALHNSYAERIASAKKPS